MTDVVMPQMGESIVEGTLTKWLKKPGEQVERDEPLFEISTDKVDTEIPSPAAGTLSEVLVEEGKTVGINTVVARISDGAEAPASTPAAKPPEPVKAAPAPAPPEEPAEAQGPLSPLVRRMARENNIDLSKVKGTGAGGRITKQDVEAYQSQAAPAPGPKPAAKEEPPAAPSAPQPAPAPTAQGKIRIEPMS